MPDVASRDGHELWDPLCFFLASIGYTIGWTAISSMLGSFKLQFGPEILLFLNAAYFLPSIPVLWLQTQLDARFNRRYGLPQATAARLIAGLGGAGLVCAAIPFLPRTVAAMLAVTVLLGLCCGVAFGTSYQLVAHFSSTCNVALTTGFVGSGPIVLLLEVLDRVGPHPTQPQRLLLYSVVVPFFTFLGLAAALLLLQWHWTELLRAGKRVQRQGSDLEGGPLLLEGSSMAGTPLDSPSASLEPSARREEAQALLRGAAQRPARAGGQEGAAAGSEASAAAAAGNGADASMAQLAAEVWPAALALAVSVGCATLVFPLFTYVPSGGQLGPLLPQVLFFARTLSDILGRLVPHRLPCLSTRAGLHCMSAAKLAATPAAFWYVTRRATRRSDAAAVAYVALFWLQSGAVNSASFVMATKWAGRGRRGRASGLMALVFQLSCLVALALAFALQSCFPLAPPAWT